MDSSLPGDSVRALLQDRSANIGVATDLGLAHTNPNARTAFLLLPSPLQPNALSDTSVRGVYVGSRGLIWLGLGSGRIDPASMKIRLSILPALENVPVLSLQRDGTRRLIGACDGMSDSCRRSKPPNAFARHWPIPQWCGT